MPVEPEERAGRLASEAMAQHWSVVQAEAVLPVELEAWELEVERVSGSAIEVVTLSLLSKALLTEELER